MQFAAAIAADGDQRQSLIGPETVLDPQALQQLVDKFGARLNELLGGDAGVKRFAQPALKSIDVRLDCRAVQIACGQLPDFRLVGREGRQCQVKSCSSP
jgi:hypothetical protein